MKKTIYFYKISTTVFTLLLVSCFSLVGCKVKTPDGKLKEKHISTAQKYVGNYDGLFAGAVEGTLSFQLSGLKPTLTFTGNNGEGILGSSCDSELGQLVSFDWDRKRKQLEYAEFELSHNCDVEGNSLVIYPQGERSLEVKVLVITRYAKLHCDNPSDIKATPVTLESTDFEVQNNIPDLPDLPDLPDFPISDINVPCPEYANGLFEK